MLRLVVPLLLLVLGTGGGLAAGLFLFSNSDQSEANAGGDAAEPVEQSDGEETDTEELRQDGSEGDNVSFLPVRPGSRDDLEYVRLNNQFVVPVVREATVRSLVVMSLTLEVDIVQNEQVFSREPRLRDAFLRVMFRHANACGFDGSFTTPVALNPLRVGLRDAAREVLGPVVNDVLIVDIVRQDA